MKKTLLALVVIGLGVANASAISYLDSETSKAGWFKISDYGYDPLAQTVYDAYAEFSFSSLASPNISLNLGGSNFNSTTSNGLSTITLLGSVLRDLSTDGTVSYSVSSSSTFLRCKAHGSCRRNWRS